MNQFPSRSHALVKFIQNILPVPAETLLYITGHFEECIILKNDFLLKEGKVSDEYFFLEEGFMRTFTYDQEANEVTTNFYGKNRMVFDVTSFFMRSIATENIQAITDCKGCSISYQQLNSLFHSVPEFREFGRAMLVKEFSAFKQRTLSLINKSAEERYHHLLQYNAEIFQVAQLRHIASFLGVTDSSLSRIRRAYSNK